MGYVLKVMLGATVMLQVGGGCDNTYNAYSDGQNNRRKKKVFDSAERQRETEREEERLQDIDTAT